MASYNDREVHSNFFIAGIGRLSATPSPSAGALEKSSPSLLGNNGVKNTTYIAMDLERRKRNRLTVALALGATFFMLIAALAVWINYLQAEERAATRRGELAEEALNERLNKHLRGQSRRISKGCESTLLIMRHCEKVGPLVSDDDGNEHCSLIGFERARYIATLFGDAPEERWPAPAHLFALSPGKCGENLDATCLSPAEC